MAMQRKHNFGPGPSTIPLEILKKISGDIIEYNHLGISILELSHRSNDFTWILEKAKHLVKKLMSLDDHYEVLFLQGGASIHFAMIPLNFNSKKAKAAYLDTGMWALKASKEAAKIRDITIVASSKKDHYNHIPKDYSVDPLCDYLHFTSNNTAYGTQFHHLPKSNVPLICDMTSDIFSRKMDFSKFDLIYAGTQKNIGIAGLGLVIIKKSFLENKFPIFQIPSYLNYREHIKNKNLFNTPNIFGIYVAMLTLKWIDSLGGLLAFEKINKKKAKILYQEIDRNKLFVGTCLKEDRSNMNITFRFNTLEEEKLTLKFDQAAIKHNIIGIKGHRLVGGYRVSLYNGLPMESLRALISMMKEFEKNHN